MNAKRLLGDLRELVGKALGLIEQLEADLERRSNNG